MAPMDYLTYGLVIAAGLWLLITAAGVLPIVLLKFTSFEPVEDDGVVEQAVAAVGREWLDAAGFVAEGAIRPLGMPIATFRHADGHHLLTVYFAQGKVITDFVSSFPNHVGVTTANTIDGVTAPLSPGSVMQCLPDSDVEARWAAHLDAMRVLRDHLNTAEVRMGPVAEEMEAAVARQRGYLVRRPWLVLTLPWRYFVTRQRYRGVTVAEQLDRGWIDPRTLADRVRSGV